MSMQPYTAELTGNTWTVTANGRTAAGWTFNGVDTLIHKPLNRTLTFVPAVAETLRNAVAAHRPNTYERLTGAQIARLPEVDREAWRAGIVDGTIDGVTVHDAHHVYTRVVAGTSQTVTFGPQDLVR